MVLVVLSAIAAKQNISLFCGFAGLRDFRVLLRPCRFIRIRPFAVAVDGSKCFRTFLTVRCGNVRSWSFSMASMSVAIGGQNKSWCINFSACCFVGIVYAFMALWLVWLVAGLLRSIVCGVLVGFMGRCHNLV